MFLLHLLCVVPYHADFIVEFPRVNLQVMLFRYPVDDASSKCLVIIQGYFSSGWDCF